MGQQVFIAPPVPGDYHICYLKDKNTVLTTSNVIRVGPVMAMSASLLDHHTIRVKMERQSGQLVAGCWVARYRSREDTYAAC